MINKNHCSNCFSQQAIIRIDQTKHYNKIVEKDVDVGPATGRIARQMQAKSDIANHSIIEADYLIDIKSGLGIVFRGNDTCLNPWALMHK